MEAIGQRFGITATRVSHIIYRNREFIKLDRNFEKIKRVSHLKRLLKKHPENIATKSTLDIISQLRDESEGKADGVQTTNTKVIIIRESNGTADQNQSGDVSRSLSVLRI
jgi:hypothetical protein